jgi:hypothetical protein
MAMLFSIMSVQIHAIGVHGKWINKYCESPTSNQHRKNDEIRSTLSIFAVLEI